MKQRALWPAQCLFRNCKYSSQARLIADNLIWFHQDVAVLLQQDTTTAKLKHKRSQLGVLEQPCWFKLAWHCWTVSSNSVASDKLWEKVRSGHTGVRHGIQSFHVHISVPLVRLSEGTFFLPQAPVYMTFSSENIKVLGGCFILQWWSEPLKMQLFENKSQFETWLWKC